MGAGDKMRFFFDAVLRNRHSGSAGRHWPLAGQGLQRAGGHIFKFGGDGVTQRGQLRQALGIAVIRLDMVVADQSGRAVRVRVQHRREVTQALRGVHKHAAQLATAHDAQCGRPA